jgi:transcriptional regulator with XRE-family HTH domain
LKLDEDRVRRKRERLGLTVAMLAQKAGTSKNTILSAEHGGDIRPTTARKIAKALDVEIDDLLGESEGPLGEARPSQLTLNGAFEEERRRAYLMAFWDEVRTKSGEILWMLRDLPNFGTTREELTGHGWRVAGLRSEVTALKNRLERRGLISPEGWELLPAWERRLLEEIKHELERADAAADELRAQFDQESRETLHKLEERQTAEDTGGKVVGITEHPRYGGMAS